MNNGLEILVLDIYKIFIKCLGAGSCPLPNGFDSRATCPHHFLRIVGSWVVSSHVNPAPIHHNYNRIYTIFKLQFTFL